MKDRHGAMLDAVLIAGNHRAAVLAVETRLTLLVQLARHTVKSFDNKAAHGRFLTEPDRCPDHQYVGPARGRCLV